MQSKTKKNFGKVHWKKTCAGDIFLNKVSDLKLVTALKKRLWHICFPVNFENFYKQLPLKIGNISFLHRFVPAKNVL